jgi:hypothetical protein
MPYVFLGLGFLAFMLTLKLLRIADKVREAFRRTRKAFAVLQLADMSDDEKEYIVRQAASRVGGKGIEILLCSTAAVIAAAVCLLSGTALGLFGLDEAFAAAGNPMFILLLTVVAAASLKFAA